MITRYCWVCPIAARLGYTATPEHAPTIYRPAAVAWPEVGLAGYLSGAAVIEWQGSLQEALAAAADTGRLVLLDFFSPT